MGAPPTLNFWGEARMLFRVFRYSFLSVFLVGITLFFSVVYRIILYILRQNVKEEVVTLRGIYFSEKRFLLRVSHLIFFVIISLIFIRLFS